MRPQYDISEQILTVKRACAVPTSQLTYTDTDWAALLNDMLQTIVVPLIMSAREDYFVTYEDVLSPSDGVIPFPSKAVGSKLRNVCYIAQTNPLNLINLPRIDLDVVAGVGYWNYAGLAGFYVQGDNFCLYPNTSVPTNTSIRLYYYRRTLKLTAPENYGQVQSIDTNTNTIVLDNVPTDWAIGTELNSVGSQPNFLITNESTTITAVSAPSVELSSIDGIEVGDYISDIGFSAIPQIPIEAMNYLCQLTSTVALAGLGDGNGAKASNEIAEKLKESLLVMVSQRVDGSVKKIVNPSGGLRIVGAAFRRGLGGW